MTKKTFTYNKEAHLLGRKRRLLKYAVAQAAKGNTEALFQHLRDDGAEEEDLGALKVLIERRGVGKPKDRSLRAETKRELVGMVRYQERLWRRNNPGKILRHGLRKKLIEDAKDFIGEERRDIQEITTEEIRQELGRGRTSR